MPPVSVFVPDSLTIASGQTSVDGNLSVSSGTVTGLSIGGFFTIVIKSQSQGSPQVTTFTISLKPGTTRPGSQTQPIAVTVNGQVVPSGGIGISY